MSRLAKTPIKFDKAIEIKLNGRSISVKGAKGTLTETLPDKVIVSIEGGQVSFKPANENEKGTNVVKANLGLSFALIRNMIKGVTDGFSKTLEIEGVGYKAASSGKSLKLNLGFSHDVDYPVPAGIEIKTPKPTEITISGIDKRLVGQVAAELRAMKKPEPYKGKGIRYTGEYIRRKEGKKK